MPVFLYKKGKPDGRQISENFHSSEFDCPCQDCGGTTVDSALVEHLEHLRTLLGSSIKINSGYRCAAYQEQLRLRGYETAKGISQHQLGKAADITNGVALGLELKDLALKAGFKAIGVGHNWIHVDMRMDKDRLWTYTR